MFNSSGFNSRPYNSVLSVLQQAIVAAFPSIALPLLTESLAQTLGIADDSETFTADIAGAQPFPDNDAGYDQTLTFDAADTIQTLTTIG
jgi:hypothetical protein